MKTMFLAAGIDVENRNIRNHFEKVTLCTRLYDQNFVEQAIMASSGHRSIAVRDYKWPSEELQRDVSIALLQGCLHTTTTAGSYRSPIFKKYTTATA